MWRAPSGGNRPGAPASPAGDNPRPWQFEAITPLGRVHTSPSSLPLFLFSLAAHTTGRRQRERESSCHTHGEHQHGVGHLAVHAGRRRARDGQRQRPRLLRVDAEQQAAGKEARGAGRGGGRGAGRAGGGRGGRRGDQAQGREAAADRAQEGLQGEDPEEGVLLVQRDWQRRHSRSGPQHPLPGGGAVQQGELRRRVHKQLRLGRDPGGGVRTIRSRAPRSSCVI